MGISYVIFRICYEIQRRTGLLALRFPKSYREVHAIDLSKWRDQKVKCFINPRNENITKKQNLRNLKESVGRIRNNQYLFFSHEWLQMPDWHTNPKSGFSYKPRIHWTRIPDFREQAGDIKYVWEKSRFCFLYDLIRYDYHFADDQAELVLSRIEDWIDSNPVNLGPNWKCSQEISLRVLNWIFALHYYQFSTILDQRIFNKITYSIYCQMRHVYSNMRFSLTALHNNHTLTEALGLYTTGLLFPFFQESYVWKKNGKQWFESEICSQIFEDGTYIQFSMNYHRVAVQLLSWALRLSEINGDQFDQKVYEKARKSLAFLSSCQDKTSGWLPNSGNNDGALFFPLTTSHFRDFRPQLNALAAILNLDLGYSQGDWEEECEWFGIQQTALPKVHTGSTEAVFSYPDGGYYIAGDTHCTTFLRCAKYSSRPFQADNLHLDIWVNGENILLDAGTYLYNTTPELTHYFAGTASHNTIQLGDNNQMKKGPRFTWTHWIRKAKGSISEENGLVIIDGEFEGYSFLKKGIVHKRKVSKRHNELSWLVEDWLENAPENIPMRQIWHPAECFFEQYTIYAQDAAGNKVIPETVCGWYSETYGKKVETPRVTFLLRGTYIRTIIRKLD